MEMTHKPKLINAALLPCLIKWTLSRPECAAYCLNYSRGTVVSSNTRCAPSPFEVMKYTRPRLIMNAHPLLKGNFSKKLGDEITARPMFSSSSAAIVKHDNKKKGRKEPFRDAKVRQILGLKNPSMDEIEKWKIRLQVMKPVSWIPLSLIVMCGAAASGNYHWIWQPWSTDFDVQEAIVGLEDTMKGFAAILLSGPFSEGFAQTINDWYDRDIDAINEPYRPIPSGRISHKEIIDQLRFLFTGGMTLALGLDLWTNHNFFMITAIALLGYFISFIYSAPPLKLKQNGWLGALAIAICYISFPWWCGLGVFANEELRLSDWLLPMVYSITGIGSAIMNDFKSVEGDTKFGLKSIPVMYGFNSAKYIVMLTQDLPQIAVAAYLYFIGEPIYSYILLSLLVPQVYFQKTLLIDEDPLKNDIAYVTFTAPLITLAILLSAVCVGNHV